MVQYAVCGKIGSNLSMKNDATTEQGKCMGTVYSSLVARATLLL